MIEMYGGPKVPRHFNFITAISASFTAISVPSRQFQLHWAIPFNICTPAIEVLGNLRKEGGGGGGSLRVISEGIFMSVSLNSFFFS